MANYRKVVMIGCGFVGAASVFALMQSGLFSEIVMIDVDKEKAKGLLSDDEIWNNSHKGTKTITVTHSDVDNNTHFWCEVDI